MDNQSSSNSKAGQQDLNKGQRGKSSDSHVPQSTPKVSHGKKSSKGIQGALGTGASTQLPLAGQSASPSKRWGSSPEQEILGYGKQLQIERELRGWTQEKLAEKISAPVLRVQNWENDLDIPDHTFRRKLAKLLGNDYYLSSEVLDNGELQVSIVQFELTAQDFSSIISALAKLQTQFLLIEQGRIADLSKYTYTQEHSIVDADLIITGLSYNSPALITFLTDPRNITTAITGVVTLAVALQKVVEAVAEAQKKLKKEKLEIEREDLDIQERKLELKQKQLQYAIEVANKVVEDFYPNSDPQTKATIKQDLLPNFSELLNVN
jgi:transcriptional regulator with XRE-family HTH domain